MPGLKSGESYINASSVFEGGSLHQDIQTFELNDNPLFSDNNAQDGIQLEAIGDGNCAYRAIIQAMLLDGLLQDKKSDVVKFLRQIFDDLGSSNDVKNGNLQNKIPKDQFEKFISEYNRLTNEQIDVDELIDKYFPTKVSKNAGDVTSTPVLPDGDPMIHYLALCLREGARNRTKDRLTQLQTELNNNHTAEDINTIKVAIKRYQGQLDGEFFKDGYDGYIDQPLVKLLAENGFDLRHWNLQVDENAPANVNLLEQLSAGYNIEDIDVASVPWGKPIPTSSYTLRIFNTGKDHFRIIALKDDLDRAIPEYDSDAFTKVSSKSILSKITEVNENDEENQEDEEDENDDDNDDNDDNDSVVLEQEQIIREGSSADLMYDLDQMRPQLNSDQIEILKDSTEKALTHLREMVLFHQGLNSDEKIISAAIKIDEKVSEVRDLARAIVIQDVNLALITNGFSVEKFKKIGDEILILNNQHSKSAKEAKEFQRKINIVKKSLKRARDKAQENSVDRVIYTALTAAVTLVEHSENLHRLKIEAEARMNPPTVTISSSDTANLSVTATFKEILLKQTKEKPKVLCAGSSLETNCYSRENTDKSIDVLVTPRADATNPATVPQAQAQDKVLLTYTFFDPATDTVVATAKSKEQQLVSCTMHHDENIPDAAFKKNLKCLQDFIDCAAQVKLASNEHLLFHVENCNTREGTEAFLRAYHELFLGEPKIDPKILKKIKFNFSDDDQTATNQHSTQDMLRKYLSIEPEFESQDKKLLSEAMIIKLRDALQVPGLKKRSGSGYSLMGMFGYNRNKNLTQVDQDGMPALAPNSPQPSPTNQQVAPQPPSA